MTTPARRHLGAVAIAVVVGVSVLIYGPAALAGGSYGSTVNSKYAFCNVRMSDSPPPHAATGKSVTMWIRCQLTPGGQWDPGASNQVGVWMEIQQGTSNCSGAAAQFFPGGTSLTRDATDPSRLEGSGTITFPNTGLSSSNWKY